ncbi:hypothetical protein SO802_026563 [Lithocarpus litseifolius]|uniref:DUF4283 domain-containing protein n=1 Tax=Lithocarpus litseifolius TaxID=425828 RepID=A0AAW2C258_9ROSI
MAEDVTSILEKMNLTSEEEEVIEIPEEGRKEGMEGCALSLIGKFLTCRPFNRKAAITMLKRAWVLEEGVQMVEVGTNLFQLKFQTKFAMDRVLKGGPWSFDNQGTPFDLVSPKIAETVGSRLGSMVEVEKKQKFQGQSYFMRVKQPRMTGRLFVNMRTGLKPQGVRLDHLLAGSMKGKRPEWSLTGG